MEQLQKLLLTMDPKSKELLKNSYGVMEFPKFAFHHTTLKQMELSNEDTLQYEKDSSRHAKATSINGLITLIMHSLLTKSRHDVRQDFHHSIFYMVLTQSYHWMKLHTSYLDSPPTCLHLIFLHYESSSFKSYPMTLTKLLKHSIDHA